MENPTPPLAAETEALVRAFAALNRGDIAGVVASFDSEIERVEPDGFPTSGTYRGIEAVMAHFAKARDTWAEGTCEPRRFIVAGQRIVVLVDVHVRLHGKTDWLDGRVADVFTFRDGKVIHWRSFIDVDEALAWAGVPLAMWNA